MGTDPHTISDLRGGCARELQRVSLLLAHYIDLERLFYGSVSARRKETERLCRFSACFKYGMVLHVAQESRPAFVSQGLFDLAGIPAPAPQESAKVFIDAVLITENSHAVGEYIRHFYWQPAENFISRLVLSGPDGPIFLHSSSGTLRFLGPGGAPHSILTLLGLEELFATQDELCHLNGAAELELTMALTASEYVVFILIRDPSTNRALSDKLFRSPATVKSHKSSIRKKIRELQPNSRAYWLHYHSFLENLTIGR
jgi:DNA-binding CsgD family transcriptional regulator